MRCIILAMAFVVQTTNAQSCTFQCDVGTDPPVPPAPPNCNLNCKCGGKINNLCLRYIGSDESVTSVTVSGSGGGWGYNEDFVLDEESKEFCIIGAELETNDKTLGPQATIGGLQLDTSCGNKFGPGFVFGDYLVVSGSSKTGGDLNCDLCCDSELVI